MFGTKAQNTTRKESVNTEKRARDRRETKGEEKGEKRERQRAERTDRDTGRDETETERDEEREEGRKDWAVRGRGQGSKRKERDRFSSLQNLINVNDIACVTGERHGTNGERAAVNSGGAMRQPQ